MAEAVSANIHLLDYWHVIRRRKLVMTATAALVLLLTGLITTLTPPLYQATSKLLITKPQLRIAIFPDSGGFSQYQHNYLATQMEIIKSRPVLELAMSDVYPDMPEEEIRERALDLTSRIRISPIGMTDMVKLAILGRDREEVVAVTNCLANAFERESSKARTEQARASYDLLADQLLTYKKRVDDADTALNRFIADTGMVKMAGYRDVDREKMMEYHNKYLDAVMRTVELELTLEQLKKIAKDATYASSARVLTESSLLQTLHGQMVEQDMELRKLSREYMEGHPLVKDLRADIDLTKSKISEETARILSAIEAELAAERAKEEHLRGIVEGYKSKAMELGEDEDEFLSLQQDVKKYKDVYEVMKKRMEEMEIVEELSEDNVSIVEEAIRAVQIRPDKRANVLCGIGAAIVLAFSTSFLTEYMDKSVRTFAQIRDRLNLQVLAVVPNMQELKEPITGSSTRPRVLDKEISRSPAAEAYRSLRTALQFMQGKDSGQALLVTSPVAGEGKSTTIANLGIVMAQSGLRVLIIDSDLRRPSIHKCFKLRNSSGVSTVLAKKETFEKAVKETGIPNLLALCSGPLPQNPAELLDSDDMSELLSDLRQKFDYVLFDSPPAIAVTDAALLSQRVDGTILVIRGGDTSVDAAEHAIETMEQVGSNLLGVVLNHVMPREGAYYYYYYYRYYDSYYYGPSRSRGDVSSSRKKPKA